MWGIALDREQRSGLNIFEMDRSYRVDGDPTALVEVDVESLRRCSHSADRRRQGSALAEFSTAGCDHGPMRKPHDVTLYRVDTRRSRSIATLRGWAIDPDDEVACTHLLRKMAEEHNVPVTEAQIEISDRSTRKKTRIQG